MSQNVTNHSENVYCSASVAVSGPLKTTSQQQLHHPRKESESFNNSYSSLFPYCYSPTSCLYSQICIEVQEICCPEAIINVLAVL